MINKKKLMGFLMVIMACAGVRGASSNEGAMGAGVLAWEFCAGYAAFSLAVYSTTQAGHKEYNKLTLQDRKSMKVITAGFALANVLTGTNRLIHGNNRGAAIAYTESAVMGFACGRMLWWDRSLDPAQQKKPT